MGPFSPIQSPALTCSDLDIRQICNKLVTNMSPCIVARRTPLRKQVNSSERCLIKSQHAASVSKHTQNTHTTAESQAMAPHPERGPSGRHTRVPLTPHHNLMPTYPQSPMTHPQHPLTTPPGCQADPSIQCSFLWPSIACSSPIPE